MVRVAASRVSRTNRTTATVATTAKQILNAVLSVTCECTALVPAPDSPSAPGLARQALERLFNGAGQDRVHALPLRPRMPDDVLHEPGEQRWPRRLLDGDAGLWDEGQSGHESVSKNESVHDEAELQHSPTPARLVERGLIGPSMGPVCGTRASAGALESSGQLPAAHEGLPHVARPAKQDSRWRRR